MKQTVRLSSKRQATFPAQLCKELGVKAGDDLILERKNIGGSMAWVLKPKKNPAATWFTGLQNYATHKERDMESIRAAIGKALAMAES